MTQRQIDRSKNFWALGLLYWLYNRPLDASLRFLEERFKESNPNVYEANKRALYAGYNYGDTTEIFTTAYRVRKAHLPEGTYRNITGAEATAMGFVTGARLHDKPISTPLTPLPRPAKCCTRSSGSSISGSKPSRRKTKLPRCPPLSARLLAVTWG